MIGLIVIAALVAAFSALAYRIWRAMTHRLEPDFIIRAGGPDPYLVRWHIIPKNRWLNVYLHLMLRDDDDRAIHDHPWINVSVLLRGAYDEVQPPRQLLRDWRKTRRRYGLTTASPLYSLGSLSDHYVRHRRRAGHVVFRRADFPHRLEVVDGPAWSLFITGPKVREWGFHTVLGWVHWRDFTDPTDPGQVRPEYRETAI